MSSNRSLPKKLYKYRPVNANTAPIVTDGEVFFPGPSKFNDPFDCRVTYSIDCTHAQFRRLVERDHLSLRQIMDSRVPDEHKANPIEWLYDHRAELVTESATQALDKHIADTGVFCLSELRDNILMWSHYAENHQGVCLEFDTHAGSDILENARQVQYGHAYPVYECFNDDLSRLVEQALFRKSTDWEYEKEWRLIGMRKANQVVALSPGTLTGVILGARIPRDKEAEVRHWLSKLNVRPQLLQARLKDGEYGLDISEC